MIHAEQSYIQISNNHLYKESTASYLSFADSYPKARALITMLGRLGNEEQIMQSLVNGDYENIWNSIKNNISPENKYKVDYLKGLLNKKNSDPELVESEEKEDLDIILIIQELYLDVYGLPMNQDACMVALESIFLKNSADKTCDGTYENIDHVVLNGNFDIRLVITDEIKKEVSIPLGICSANTLEAEWLEFLCEQVQKEDTEDMYNTNYFFRNFLGESNYQKLVMSENKLETLEEINKERISTLNSNSLIQLLKMLEQKDYQALIDTFSYYSFDLIREGKYEEIRKALNGLSIKTGESPEMIIYSYQPTIYEKMSEILKENLPNVDEVWVRSLSND